MANCEERGLDRLEGSPVVEVVGLDVGHDACVRRQRQERAVALVGLGHEVGAGAEVRVAAALVELAADRERRVGAAVLQRHREHRGGRRLAVRAGDGDAAVALHQSREGLGPPHHAQPALARGDQLGVLGLDGRRDDDGVGLGDVRRVVADPRVDADGTQRRDTTGVLRVAAAHGHPTRHQDARDAGHACAADADHVHATQRCEVGGLGRHRSPPAVVRVPPSADGPAASASRTSATSLSSASR